VTQFEKMCEGLENEIQASYETGVTSESAEKLAGEFLFAQFKVSAEIKAVDLDARMRKAGLKAVKASVYMEAATKSEKKPTEAMIEAIINSTPLVNSEQAELDKAEVTRDSLERYYSIFREAHIHFRTICKGNFGS